MNDEMSVGAMLTEQLDRLFEKSVTHELLTRTEAGAFPQALWDELENIGVAAALVPEQTGGVGLAWSECESAWHSMGYHAAPVPLGETMIGRWALARAGLEAPDGPLAVVAEALELDAAGRIGGTDAVVPWAGQAEHLVAVANRAGESFVCMLRGADCPSSASPTIGRIPGARLRFPAVAPLALAPWQDHAALGLLPQVAVLRATQMAGCLDRLLALCVEYGNTRVQFGRPIGKFQAIQHQIASLAEQAAAAQVAGRLGCSCIDRGKEEFGAAVAKIRAGQSAMTGAAIAHQVFGAMGVTDEHMLHFFTRRLWQWRDEGESEHWWSERLGHRTIDAGGVALWPALVA